jgi:hypothetical protein
VVERDKVNRVGRIPRLHSWPTSYLDAPSKGSPSILTPGFLRKATGERRVWKNDSGVVIVEKKSMTCE